MKFTKTIPTFKQGTLLFCGVLVAILVVFSEPIQEGLKAQFFKQTCEQSCPLDVRGAKKVVDMNGLKEKKTSHSSTFPTILFSNSTIGMEEFSNSFSVGSKFLSQILEVLITKNIQ
jgi:hypothetical protein